MPVYNRLGSSRDIAKHPFIVICTESHCTLHMSAPSYEEGVRVYGAHHCPHLGGPTKIGYSVTLTIVETAWQKLDAVMDLIMDPAASTLPEQTMRAKYEARGMAEIIALFMGPFFTTPDDVAKEAKKRWQARRDGDTAYETVGLGHLKYQAPPGGPRDKTVEPAHKLTDKEIAGIKAALGSGMMKDVELAKMYGVSVAIIRQVSA
jgi:hypothetical protein